MNKKQLESAWFKTSADQKLKSEGARYLKQMLDAKGMYAALYPVEGNPIQVAKHPVLKKSVRRFANQVQEDFRKPHKMWPTKFLVNAFKVMPSSIMAEVRLNPKGLLLHCKEHKAKNYVDGIVRVAMGDADKYHAPSLKSQLYVLHQHDRDTFAWYPAKAQGNGYYLLPLGKVVDGKLGVVKGFHKAARTPYTREYKDDWGKKRRSVQNRSNVWAPKNKVTEQYPYRSVYMYALEWPQIDKNEAVQRMFLKSLPITKDQRFSLLWAWVTGDLSREIREYKLNTKKRGENGGVVLEFRTEMDWEYDREHMSYREFFDAYDAICEEKRAKLQKLFPQYKVEIVWTHEDGKSVDFEIFER